MMPKRKRETDIEEQISQIPDQALRIRVSRLKARFEHGVSQLTAQLRLARGFDRQKMTRRVKQAGKDQTKIKRLNAEIQILNDIKEPKVARTYLIKQCARTKRIAESEAFVALFGTDPEAKTKAKAGATSVTESNVLGRLFKVEAVSKVLPEIMKGIREVLGVDKPVEATSHASADGTKQETVAGSSSEPSDNAEDFAGFSDASERAMNADDLDRSAKFDTDEALFDSNDEILAGYESRLAASSDEDEDDEAERRIDGQNHDRFDDMEITTDEGEGSELDIKMESTPEYDSENLKPVQAPPTSASFLPSLMHGGYYSGSDSEGEEDPDAAFAGLTKPERKNRRGQKARQAIAEKKYGGRAKHLVKAKGAEGVHDDRQRLIQGQGRNDGWDARKGAVSSADGKPQRVKERTGSKTPNRFERRNGYAKTTDVVKRIRSGPKPEPNGERPRPAKAASKPDEKLHPSWEAARKKKMESAAAGAGSFAGKKITFD